MLGRKNVFTASNQFEYHYLRNFMGTVKDLMYGTVKFKCSEIKYSLEYLQLKQNVFI